MQFFTTVVYIWCTVFLFVTVRLIYLHAEDYNDILVTLPPVIKCRNQEILSLTDKEIKSKMKNLNNFRNNVANGKLKDIFLSRTDMVLVEWNKNLVGIAQELVMNCDVKKMSCVECHKFGKLRGSSFYILRNVLSFENQLLESHNWNISEVDAGQLLMSEPWDFLMILSSPGANYIGCSFVKSFVNHNFEHYEACVVTSVRTEANREPFGSGPLCSSCPPRHTCSSNEYPYLCVKKKEYGRIKRESYITSLESQALTIDVATEVNTAPGSEGAKKEAVAEGVTIKVLDEGVIEEAGAEGVTEVVTASVTKEVLSGRVTEVGVASVTEVGAEGLTEAAKVLAMGTDSENQTLGLTEDVEQDCVCTYGESIVCKCHLAVDPTMTPKPEKSRNLETPPPAEHKSESESKSVANNDPFSGNQTIIHSLNKGVLKGLKSDTVNILEGSSSSVEQIITDITTKLLLPAPPTSVKQITTDITTKLLLPVPPSLPHSFPKEVAYVPLENLSTAAAAEKETTSSGQIYQTKPVKILVAMAMWRWICY